jgi:hypothetical protein
MAKIVERMTEQEAHRRAGQLMRIGMILDNAWEVVAEALGDDDGNDVDTIASVFKRYAQRRRAEGLNNAEYRRDYSFGE